MTVSKSQKAATAKYEAKTYDKVLVRMPKGRKEAIQAHAETHSESVNGFINRAIGEAMGESPQKPAGAPQILTPETLQTAQEAAQSAGETVPVFIGRAVETQAQRDKVTRAMRPKEKAPDKSET